jgi:hypothetical protein
LSRAEDLGELSDLSDSDNDNEGKPRAFHHPFEVKDRGPIVMNIRNSIPHAPKPASELKAIMSQFPVSSGKQHSIVENTWIPVTTTNSSSTTTTSSVTTVATISKPVTTLTKQIQEQLPELAMPKPKPVVTPAASSSTEANIPTNVKPYDWKSDDHYCKAIVPELAPPPEVRREIFKLLRNKVLIAIFLSFTQQQPPCDVSEIISQRLNAMRKLQENPNDVQASKVLFETQQNVRAFTLIIIFFF